MKKKMILEKWKTKAVAMMMAGVMVFAMAPLGTGVAFADENDAEPADEPAVEAVEDVVVEASEEAVVDAPEDMDAQVGAAGINKGYLVVDLSKGPASYRVKYTVDEEGDLYTDDMPLVLQFINEFMHEDAFTMSPMPDGSLGYLIDLDKNGSNDVKMTATMDEGELYGTFTFTKTGTCSVAKDISFDLPAEALDEMLQEVPEDYEYYIGLQFVTGGKASAANPLTVKGKTVKIKAKKMKKKAKTYTISKFLTVSNAQGAVTYAKASGSKKIKIATNGKVTLKKKIKKGKYVVKVNVTAAGNDNYSKVTKTVAFTVKVK